MLRAFLREARDLAALAGDFSQAIKAVDALESRYRIDAFEMKAATLETVARRVTTATGKELVESTYTLTDEAIAADDYESAARFLQTADSVAAKIQSATPDLRDPVAWQQSLRLSGKDTSRPKKPGQRC